MTVLLVFAMMMVVPESAWFPGTSSVDETEVIPPAYRGTWGINTAACKAEYGTERMEVKSIGADFWESGARLERVTQSGQERAIKLKLSYEGEGDFWDTVERWELSI